MSTRSPVWIPVWIFALCCLGACQGSKGIGGDNTRLDEQYQRALVNAALPTARDVTDALFPLRKSNAQLRWNADSTQVLVLTWKSWDSYNRYLKDEAATDSSENYVVWVTLAPEVQRFCQAFVRDHTASKAELDLRLKQYLGLNHHSAYDVFVEMWVAPEDVFRPCLDPSPDDQACALRAVSNAPTPVVKNIDDYAAFFRDIYYDRFRTDTPYPWTGLGYTYDWGHGTSDVGASEYILSPATPYVIERAVPTIAYCTVPRG